MSDEQAHPVGPEKAQLPLPDPGSDASAGPSPRARLLSAVRRRGSRAQLTAAVLLAVVGFASVVQVQATERNDDYEGMREEDLVQLLNSLESASQRSEKDIAQLEDARASLRSSTDNREATLEQARTRATVLGILAGTTPAVGPGVRVTVEDPQERVGIDQMLNGIEELRNAGAEAIEINNEVRVVADTALEDGEGGIVADGKQLSPPYVIEAIGDPHTLKEGLVFTGGFVQDIQDPETIDGKVTIKKLDDGLEVETVTKPAQLEYAEPADRE